MHPIPCIAFKIGCSYFSLKGTFQECVIEKYISVNSDHLTALTICGTSTNLTKMLYLQGIRPLGKLPATTITKLLSIYIDRNLPSSYLIGFVLNSTKRLV